MQRRLGLENLKGLASLILVIVSCVSLSGVAFAQGAPNDYQIGLPQHGEFSGTDFEHVQMNNNNLHIDLPLWSAAGRGPSVGFKYVYDSKGWSFREHCNRISGTCTDTVTPGPPGTLWENHLHLTLVGPGYDIKSQTGVYTCNGTGVQLVTFSYSLNTPAGTSHHFVPDPIQIAGEGATCLPQPTTLYADDGSGWMLSVDQSSGSVIKAVGKDGTVVSGIEDANGNQIGFGTPSTDTLGRQFNTDGSYYDSSGVLRTIPVVKQYVAIQTNLCSFSSGDFCNEYSSTWY